VSPGLVGVGDLPAAQLLDDWAIKPALGAVAAGPRVEPAARQHLTHVRRAALDRHAAAVERKLEGVRVHERIVSRPPHTITASFRRPAHERLTPAACSCHRPAAGQPEPDHATRSLSDPGEPTVLTLCR